jgi:hypothetical protein
MTESKSNVSDKILSPKELGITSKGSALSSNIDKLFNGYIKLLTTGGTMAVRGGKYLGNRYLKKTGTKCISTDGKERNRSILIDTIPCNSKENGLIAGVFTGIKNLKSDGLMKAVKTKGKPKCSKVVINTVDNNNNNKIMEAYVVNDEITNITPCALVNVRGQKENFYAFEEFINYNFMNSQKKENRSDRIETMFKTSFGVILIYLTYRLSLL